jgi:hypothetical protein
MGKAKSVRRKREREKNYKYILNTYIKHVFREGPHELIKERSLKICKQIDHE